MPSLRSFVRLLAVVAVALVSGAGVALTAGTAVAVRADNCAAPGVTVKPVPWAQQMLTPERVWPFSRGGGVTVAVLDSGVDGQHPQLRGQVAEGFDALAGSGPANADCAGTGTQIAGLIAGLQVASSGFAGIAPAARILPIRVVDRRDASTTAVDAKVLARGITWATDHGAGVIAIAVVSYADNATLRSAIGNALARNVIVVAAVGDLGGPDAGNPTPYPAAYPGVVGVGAIDPTGQRASGSQYGSYVDLVAPGADLTTLQRGGGMTASAQGTGMACGFVAAVAALVRAGQGDLSREDLVQRLFATAVAGPGGPEYGYGVVDPYAAVNSRLATKASPVPLPGPDRAATGTVTSWIHSRDFALTGTVVGVLVTLGVLAVAGALPRGRRRRWRAALAGPPPDRPEPAEPGPPVLLFDEKA
jgi:type VII secretion-associated serine protease mycosin